MDELRSKLFYEQKNGYDLIDTEERLKVEDYCKGYMAYLDRSRMEREAVASAIELAEDLGFAEYVPGMEVLDRKSTRLNSSHPTTSRMPSSA